MGKSGEISYIIYIIYQNVQSPAFGPILTLAGPTPTNTSWNSEPLAVMKGTLASPAMALASKVFPVPGGPDNSAPYGQR